jgi:hypothetical protein
MGIIASYSGYRAGLAEGATSEKQGLERAEGQDRCHGPVPWVVRDKEPRLTRKPKSAHAIPSPDSCVGRSR